MDVRTFIKSGKMETSVPCIKQCSCVNIGYYTKSGREDETQLDVSQNLLGRAGVEELHSLFEYMSKELDANVSRISYIDIVASADTMEELRAMGY